MLFYHILHLALEKFNFKKHVILVEIASNGLSFEDLILLLASGNILKLINQVQ